MQNFVRLQGNHFTRILVSKKMVNKNKKMAYKKIDLLPINEDYPQSFNLEQFKQLQSFKQRVAYCDQNLEKLGSGSSRIVYKVDDKMVMKLAKNAKGLAQNEVEASQGQGYYMKGLVAEVYAYHEDYLWLESEFCKKITKKTFASIVGVTFEQFCSVLNYIYFDNNPRKGFKRSKPDFNWDDNEFITNMVDYMVGYDTPVGDLCKISSYGVNSKGDVVMTDYGLTDDVFQEHYSRR